MKQGFYIPFLAALRGNQWLKRGLGYRLLAFQGEAPQTFVAYPCPSAFIRVPYLNRHRRVDLVLTDITLAPVAPGIRGMNGIDLTGIITRNWGIPVIVMTGYKPVLLSGFGRLLLPPPPSMC